MSGKFPFSPSSSSSYHSIFSSMWMCTCLLNIFVLLYVIFGANFFITFFPVSIRDRSPEQVSDFLEHHLQSYRVVRVWKAKSCSKLPPFPSLADFPLSSPYWRSFLTTRSNREGVLYILRRRHQLRNLSGSLGLSLSTCPLTASPQGHHYLWTHNLFVKFTGYQPSCGG